MSQIFSLWQLVPNTTTPTVTTNSTEIAATQFRATTVEDMYDLVTNAASIGYDYQVGVVPDGHAYKIRVRNKCVEHTLGLGVTFPRFLQIVPFGLLIDQTESSFTQTYILPVGYTLDLTVTMNESFVRDMSATRRHSLASSIIYNITPLNVSGPVLVQKNVPPLTFT